MNRKDKFKVGDDLYVDDAVITPESTVGVILHSEAPFDLVAVRLMNGKSELWRPSVLKLHHICQAK